jgi:hypothetical protein
MGLFFNREQKKQVDVPLMRELLYPESLVSFNELERGGHKDNRALVYTIYRINLAKKRSYSSEEINYVDFEKRHIAYKTLVGKKLIEDIKKEEELAEIFSKDELVKMAKEKEIKSTGEKRAIAERLVENGCKIDRRKHKKRFRLTDKGREKITQYFYDEEQAKKEAIDALRELDYKNAIEAYRKFDRRWGFSHTSGKNHTIFAHYDIPYGRFQFIENYPMLEVHNTEYFKKTLKACILAGLMRGAQDRWEIRMDFEMVCTDALDCPRLLEMFDYDSDVINNMREQIVYDKGNALEYYISHVEYLSRQV